MGYITKVFENEVLTVDPYVASGYKEKYLGITGKIDKAILSFTITSYKYDDIEYSKVNDIVRVYVNGVLVFEEIGVNVNQSYSVDITDKIKVDNINSFKFEIERTDPYADWDYRITCVFSLNLDIEGSNVFVVPYVRVTELPKYLLQAIVGYLPVIILVLLFISLLRVIV